MENVSIVFDDDDDENAVRSLRLVFPAIRGDNKRGLMSAITIPDRTVRQ